MNKKNADGFRQMALKLYKEGKTVKEIQTILGKSESVVYTYLKDTNAGLKTSEEKSKTKREKVIKLYTEDKLTLKQISDKLGIAIVTLYRYLKKESIPIRENSTGLSMTEQKREQRLEETMQVYMEENRSISKTAKRLGVSENTVRSRLGETIKQENNKPRKKTPPNSIQKMENMKKTEELAKEKKTAKEIGEILGVSTRTVFSYYKELGIKGCNKKPSGVKRKSRTSVKKTTKKIVKEVVKDEPPKRTYIKPTIEFKETVKKEELEPRNEILFFPPIPETIRGKLPPDFLANYKNVRDKSKQKELTTEDLDAFWKSAKQDRRISDIIDAIFISKLYEHIGDKDAAKKVLYKEFEAWRKVEELIKKQKPINSIMEENFKKTQEKARIMKEKIQERLRLLAIGQKTSYSLEQEEK